MRGTKRVAQGITELGKKMRNTKASVVGELKSIGGSLAHKTTGLRSSLRKLAKQVKRGS